MAKLIGEMQAEGLAGDRADGGEVGRPGADRKRGLGRRGADDRQQRQHERTTHGTTPFHEAYRSTPRSGRRQWLPLSALVLLAACGQQSDGARPSTERRTEAQLPDPALRPVAPAAPAAKGAWSLSGDGATLAFSADGDGAPMRLACAPRSGVLRVILATVRPIASEERLSFGGGGDVVALVARTDGSRVEASGEAPGHLGAMLLAGPGASYGATAIGPLPPVASDIAERFASHCARPPAPPPPTPSSPCHVEDGKPVDIRPMRALGTEPFWGAAIDGRCVTYSTPENQKGVRVWTRTSVKPDRIEFVGALSGKPFRLMLARRQCSDGMSDRRYAWQATLAVLGEERRGCAMNL